MDVTPPTNGSEIAGWLAKVNAANIPNIPPTVDGTCDSDQARIPQAGANGTCWWTCGGCVRPTDISACPQKDVWGVSYDDGPSDYTAKLLNYMNIDNLKATFFVVSIQRVFTLVETWLTKVSVV